MSETTETTPRITAWKVATALFWSLLIAGLASKMLVVWLFDGPMWARIAVFVGVFAFGMSAELLAEDETPPRRTYRRWLAERGLGRRPTDD